VYVLLAALELEMDVLAEVICAVLQVQHADACAHKVV
jgi:hypothetical protein